jgi:threonine synthase
MQPSSFLDTGLCTNHECRNYQTAFSLSDFPRCPLCNEPARLLDELSPTILQVGGSIYEKYFGDKITSLLGKYHDLMIPLSENIGMTSLVHNPRISEWTHIENLYLKDERSNPSGSFKERGSWTAVALHLAQLFKKNEDVKELTIGTVSTGNMAISTAWMVNRIAQEHPEFKIKSFILVDENVAPKKRELIEKAAGKNGITIFMVKGNYALIHDIVYKTCHELRQKGRHIFAELTDDVFRITGYATLFTEIIDQMKENGKVPDYVIVPVASGGLFRVGIWAFEKLKEQGIIDKIPHLVLVQEKGADPIVRAFENNEKTSEPIVMGDQLVAQAIDVSNSRSGTESLRILQEGYHLCLSVTADEITESQSILGQNNFFVEAAGAVATAAAKKLYEKGIVKGSYTVVSILSGAEPSTRVIYQLPLYDNKIVHCQISELSENLTKSL